MKVDAVVDKKSISPALLDVVSFCAYRTHEPQLQETMFTLAKSIVDDKENSKRGYRLLVALLKNEKSSNELIQQIRTLLKLNSCKIKSNVEALRLECIETLAHVVSDPYVLLYAHFYGVEDIKSVKAF